MIKKPSYQTLSKETTTSSMFSHVAYNEKTKTLTVTFRASHHKYAYSGVSKEMYDRMIKAASTGSFFNTYIKNVYQYSIL